MPRELTREKPLSTDVEVSEDNLDEFRTHRVTKDVEPSVKPGWSSDVRPRSTGNTQVDRFAVPDDGEEILIKFLDETPFAPIFQHWVLADGGKRRAFTCAGTNSDGESICPMCKRGDRPKSSDWFNVVELGDEPKLKVWYASADPAGAIKEKSQGKRTSPINKDGLYFAISKKKASTGFNTFTVERVEEDELETDWGVKPLSADQLKKFNSQKYDGSLVKIHTTVELADAARKFLSDE
jgi:hypothetical protein